MNERSTLLVDGPADAAQTLVLAHGAGAAMDSEFMQEFAVGLARAGLRVVRFEFPYMAQRRSTGARRPPDREPVLRAAFHEALRAGSTGQVFLGGKSMGGRIASLIADEVAAAGLVCLGYPFHPVGKPGQLRTAHLAQLATPTLIVQGERDTFGKRSEVESYVLASTIRVHWIADGDHSLVPRKSSGRSKSDNWAEAIAAVAQFIRSLAAQQA